MISSDHPRCANCATELTGRRTRYCSSSCREQHYNKQIKVSTLPKDRTCKRCGKELTGRQTAWCSLSCKREFGAELALINEIETLVRRCTRCKLQKPLHADFYKTPTGTYRRICKACLMETNAERNEKPDAAHKRRQQHLRGLYGITAEEYELLLRAQGGVCAVCKKPPRKRRLSVDHDHVTMRVRGLLCNYCNLRIIGKARDAELYRQAAEYLSNPPAEGLLHPDHQVPGNRPKKKRKRVEGSTSRRRPTSR